MKRVQAVAVLSDDTSDPRHTKRIEMQFRETDDVAIVYVENGLETRRISLGIEALEALSTWAQEFKTYHLMPLEHQIWVHNRQYPDAKQFYPDQHMTFLEAQG